jgi:hypothetical protein
MTPQQPTEGPARETVLPPEAMEVIRLTFSDPYRTIVVEPISVPAERRPAERPAPDLEPEREPRPVEEPEREPDPVGGPGSATRLP